MMKSSLLDYNFSLDFVYAIPIKVMIVISSKVNDSERISSGFTNVSNYVYG